jgi:DNA-binding transcriptional LysR family regulator
MFDWDDLRFFLAVSKAGSIARAADELGLNATTVSRRLAALEAKIEARLFDRTSDGYLLTAAGRDLVPHAERMEAAVQAAARTVVAADRRVRGVVRVTATEMITTRFIAPHVARLRRAHPDLTVDFHCSHETVSLSRREADIALRLARPKEPDVIARKLAPIPLALYAARSYVDAHGMPEDPERSLAGHAVLCFAAIRHFAIENAWMDSRVDGAQLAMRSDSVSSLFAACLAGVGIALLPRAVADPEPGLVRIVTATRPEPRMIWRAVHRDLVDTARVRAVIEFLETLLRPPDEA